MQSSKKISWVLHLFLAMTTSCQTTGLFRMKTLGDKELHIVDVESNRIIHKCHFMNAEKENNWRHQYALYILNDLNEVIPVLYPTNQDDSQCLAHKKKVTKILQNGPRIKLCLRGDLETTTEKNVIKEVHDFGKLGKHKSPYYSLTFDTICNSKDCYSISDTWTYTCPDFGK